MDKKELIKLFERYMLLVGVGGSLVFYLQAIKIFTERSASDVSFPAFLVGLVSVISWMVYGILIKNKVLIISNIFATIGASMAVIGILIY